MAGSTASLAPIIPHDERSTLTRSGVLAIVAYPAEPAAAVAQGSGRFGPNDTPGVFVMSVQPGAVYAKLPKPLQ